MQSKLLNLEFELRTKNLPKKNREGASRALWKLWTDFRNLQLENDLIKRNNFIDEFNNLAQIVIRKLLLNEILPLFHKHYGHFGMAKTFDRVHERFYWPGMIKRCLWVFKFIRIMLQTKPPTQKIIHSLTICRPSHPFGQIA